MMPTSDAVRQAIELAEAGKNQEGRDILVDLLRADQDNAEVWGALARLSETTKDAIYCLKQVLRVQPDNEWARTSLQQLRQRGISADSGPQPPAIRRKRLVFGAAGMIVGLVIIAGLVISSLVAGGRFPLAMFSPAAGEPDPQSATPLSGMSTSAPGMTPSATDAQTMPSSVEPDPDAASTMLPSASTEGTAMTSQALQTSTPTLTASPALTHTPAFTPTDYPTPTDPPEPGDVPTDEPIPALGPCDCYMDSLTCRDFDTQAEAQACYDYCLGETEMDIFGLDPNHNNVACEDLP